MIEYTVCMFVTEMTQINNNSSMIIKEVIRREWIHMVVSNREYQIPEIQPANSHCGYITLYLFHY